MILLMERRRRTFQSKHNDNLDENTGPYETGVISRALCETCMHVCSHDAILHPVEDVSRKKFRPQMFRDEGERESQPS